MKNTTQGVVIFYLQERFCSGWTESIQFEYRMLTFLNIEFYNIYSGTSGSVRNLFAGAVLFWMDGVNPDLNNLRDKSG